MKTLLTVLSSFLLCAAALAQTNTPSPPSAAQNPAVTNAVGIAASDGITISGLDVLVTRNGLTEKLQKELTLANGSRVRPDGTVIKADGSTITLRPDQVLTFQGKIVDATPPPTPAQQ